jgi:hypothetical protein
VCVCMLEIEYSGAHKLFTTELHSPLKGFWILFNFVLKLINIYMAQNQIYKTKLGQLLYPNFLTHSFSSIFFWASGLRFHLKFICS